MKNTFISILVLFLMVTCKPIKQQEISVTPAENGKRKLAKFEPNEGVLLFVGQELEAVGGLEEYKDGYLDHFDKPAGWTTYTNINPGEYSFYRRQRGLDGLWETHDWGDNDYNAILQHNDPDYSNMAIAIGLQFVNHEKRVADGTHDKYIDKLGDFLISLGERPVFLRIAYEFDGPWNDYDRKSTIAAYKHIVDKLRARGVNNTAYVWQSAGTMAPDLKHLEKWYPGDDYVDWLGFSFFNGWKKQKMIEFARPKGKPVFIAEATPTSSDLIYDPLENQGITKEMQLSNPRQAQMAWDEWFLPFFNTINTNLDVVKAVHYINCHWDSHPMWFQNPTFKKIDARLHLSDTISKQWKERTLKAPFILSSEELYDKLYNNK